MDPAALLVLCFTATLTFALLAAAALRGWQDWLAVRQLQLGAPGRGSGRPAPARELRELRERVRRLEAIANGAEG